MKEVLNKMRRITVSFSSFGEDSLYMLELIWQIYKEKLDEKVYFIFGDEFEKQDYRRLRDFFKHSKIDPFKSRDISVTVKRERNVYNALYCFQKRKIEWLRVYENQFI
jgi:predicted phosphoadenosine phosphosulfate sulfurtransferase